MATIRWRVIPPCAITLAAMLCGVASIVHALQGNPFNAAVLIFTAMLLDGIDGAVARLLKGTSSFGMELDSFSDAIALGLAPGILVYSFSLDLAAHENLPDWLPSIGAVLCAMITTAGVFRLARFRLTSNPHVDKDCFQGLAIGGPAGWVALFGVCHRDVTYALGDCVIPFSVSHGPLAVAFWVILVILPFLEISSVAYPKPTKCLWKFALFAVCLVCTLAVPVLRPWTALLLLGYGVWYTLCAPLCRCAKKRRGSPS